MYEKGKIYYIDNDVFRYKFRYKLQKFFVSKVKIAII